MFLLRTADFNAICPDHDEGLDQKIKFIKNRSWSFVPYFIPFPVICPDHEF